MRLWRIEYFHFLPGNEKLKNPSNPVNPVYKQLIKIESIPYTMQNQNSKKIDDYTFGFNERL
jgi:hypothetical protein